VCCSSGHAGALTGADLFKSFASWTDQYGPIFKLRLLHTPVVVVTDPDLAQQVLRKSSPEYVPKDRSMYWPLELGVKPQLPNILTDSDGPYWKAVRTAVAVCFSITNLKKVRADWGLDEPCLHVPHLFTA
jgi:cytochrome P450